MGYSNVSNGLPVILHDGAGYANYGGKGNPPPAYAFSDDAARSMLDGARAVRNMFKSLPAKAELMGHSHGGHMTLSALAKAARRPVKLVLTRREEFVAVDHRREGMVIELETGARRDGTIVARRAKLWLDKGAYTGEGGFFAQMAAMHVCGPYELGAVDVEARLNYSNNQPSSSIRAPTAPQVCWALEQHMDEVADAIGMDPAELRRRKDSF